MLFCASPLKGALHGDEKEIIVFNVNRITNLKASSVWDFHLYVCVAKSTAEILVIPIQVLPNNSGTDADI